MLAAVLMRTPGQEFILCGHSLGARVIAYALLELAKHGRDDIVRTAHLMGGAVTADDHSMWESIASVCRGGVANYFSTNDDVLKLAYVPAMGFNSTPIGRSAIRVRGVRNVDVSRLVGGHMEYKARLPQFISYPMGLVA